VVLWLCIGKACVCSLEMKLATLNLKAVCTLVVLLGSLKFDTPCLVPLKGYLTSYRVRVKVRVRHIVRHHRINLKKRKGIEKT